MPVTPWQGGPVPVRGRGRSAAAPRAVPGTTPPATPPEDPLTPDPLTQDPTPPTFTELEARRLGRVRRFFARRPVASDVLVCVLYVLAAVTGVGPDLSAMSGAGAWSAQTREVLSIALTVLGLVALVFRRRWPVRVAITLAGLAVVHVLVTGWVGAFVIGFALALYVVAAARPQRLGWLVLGSATAAVLGALLLWGGVEGPPTPGDGVTVTGADGRVIQPGSATAASTDTPSFLLAGLVALAVGANVRGRRLHTRALVERHQQLMDAGEQHAKLAAAAEQARIAREMHDVVAHGLTVMIALSDGARVAVRRSPDDAEHALDLLSETGRSALADMRRMLGVLRGADVPLEPQPGSQDLEALVQQFRAAGLTVHLTTTGPPLPDDAALALTVYRVVQESLTNALRHAGAGARVDVLVRHGTGRVGVEVVDDGGGARPVPDAEGEPGRLGRIGERLTERRDDPLEARTDAAGDAHVVAPPARTGRGLVGMRERAAVYRGSVAAGPSRSGWRVHVELRTDDDPGTTPTDLQEHA
ncbi:histidine kinase [Cellulomonas sp. Marseille-Q8402]